MAEQGSSAPEQRLLDALERIEVLLEKILNAQPKVVTINTANVVESADKPKGKTSNK